MARANILLCAAENGCSLRKGGYMVKMKRCLTVQPRKLSRKIRKSGDGKTLRMDPAKYHELHTVDQGS